MDREALAQALGRELQATDQPPGTYRYKEGRRCPWQAVSIKRDRNTWYVLVNGEPVGSASDPADIPFIRDKGPFHEIDYEVYLQILDEYSAAKPGTPLRNPHAPVNLRQSRPI